jgi:hypothetical protein
VNGYEALKVRLKSGNYDGSDIMQAWLALEKIADLTAQLDRTRGYIASIIIHLSLPEDKRDDGVIMKLAENALRREDV